MAKKYYKVEEEDLIRYLEAYAELTDLENAGVDNWDNYGEHVDTEEFDSYTELAMSWLEDYEEVK